MDFEDRTTSNFSLAFYANSTVDIFTVIDNSMTSSCDGS